MKFPFGTHKGWYVKDMVLDEVGRAEAEKYLKVPCKDPKFQDYMDKLKAEITQELARSHKIEPVVKEETVVNSPSNSTVMVKLLAIEALLEMIKDNTGIVAEEVKKKKEKEYKEEPVGWEDVN